MRYKIIILLLVVSFSESVIAQMEWAPIGAEWNYSQYYSSPPQQISNVNVKSISDTIISGKIVKKVVQTYTSFLGNINRKEYFTYEENNRIYVNKLNSSSQFELIYDFNLITGDTVSIYFRDFDQFYTMVIDSMSSRMIDNQIRKIWHVDDNCFYYGPEIIEGIGSLQGLVPSACSLISDNPIVDFNCYSDSTVDYMLVDNCTFWGLVSGTESLTKITFKVYPNPSSDQLNIEVENISSERLNYKIYDSLGNLLVGNFLSDNIINVSFLPTGTYFLEIFNGESRAIRKFVVI